MWIIKNQFGRRNLSRHERAKLILQMEDIIKGQAKERMSEGGKNKGERISAHLKEDRKPQSRDELAKLAGVSRDDIDNTKKVASSAVASKLEEMIESKELSLSAAAKIAKLPEAEQRAVIDKPVKEIKERAKTWILRKRNESTISGNPNHGVLFNPLTVEFDSSIVELLLQSVDRPYSRRFDNRAGMLY